MSALTRSVETPTTVAANYVPRTPLIQAGYVTIAVAHRAKRTIWLNTVRYDFVFSRLVAVKISCDDITSCVVWFLRFALFWGNIATANPKSWTSGD